MSEKLGTASNANKKINSNTSVPTIKNVWRYNLEKEFSKISQILDEGFTYVAMDTEFPGVIYTANVEAKSPQLAYSILKSNVDDLNLIQVGLSFSNDKGVKPEGINTWQFNLKFNVNSEKSHPESIALLKDAGIVFSDLEEHGCDPMEFGNFLMTSGLVINSDITWIAFHGSYDFSYLMKVLLNSALPPTYEGMLTYIHHIFPSLVDLKVVINDIEEWKNYSLAKLSAEVGARRFGVQHQAGSDALVTLESYFKLRNQFLNSDYMHRQVNKIYGISVDIVQNTFSNQQMETMLPNFYHYQQFYHGQNYYGDLNQVNAFGYQQSHISMPTPNTSNDGFKYQIPGMFYQGAPNSKVTRTGNGTKGPDYGVNFGGKSH